MRGRCSPLCGLVPTTSSRGKGKERERLEEWEQFDEKETRHLPGRTESEKGKERITNPNPRKVHSPTRELEKGSRPLGALSMERVASGSGTSRGSRARDGATSVVPSSVQANIKAKRIKHGSFDFERPVSAGQSKPLPSANVNGRTIAPPHALQRSSSTRGPARRVTLDDGRQDRHTPLSSSLPKARPKPALDIDTHNLARRTTGSSAATSRGQPLVIPRSSGSKAHHGSETDPGSPISSTHSGNSSALNSSWGKNAGKRIARAAHPAFKFEPAVPTIPGSPADSDERKRSIASSGTASPMPPSPLSKSRQARNVGKGRSLDLNLGLSWAPTKVREDALSRTAAGRVTPDLAARAGARWRAATSDERDRFGAGQSGAEVADVFREVLGDAAYSTFKTYVHRYDARAIPLDGPFGLMNHVQRLLDSAPGLDSRRKQVLLHKLNRVVQEIR
ncbi:uncharacterized protein C8Q71DRAFT_697140 [Rhodofomes roseus]|uniref:Uncharacterized protein n=1 Tax=Rhodofomes roseus TaxID=34475 RepID=A0ABQ8KXV6_9APHY|nr:uncharacterized protein C8Q71DRAFT_697140 [Rhodofomes roseus]KAH9844076.1 hypothetical protein C8Q71DRAFT_697140 [Rhodofomes roseus]